MRVGKDGECVNSYALEARMNSRWVNVYIRAECITLSVQGKGSARCWMYKGGGAGCARVGKLGVLG